MTERLSGIFKKTFMKRLALYTIIIAAFHSCTGSRPVSGGDDNKITLTFVQINDVYEIGPLENGNAGGMARVATLKKKYREKNPNTFLVMAGDFLSPSVYNSLQYEGKRIRGRQMVEAMDAAGTDIAVFGNHEFDISENELQSRLNESQFLWVSSNSFHKRGDVISPFTKVKPNGVEIIQPYYLMKVRDADGTVATVGFIGITLPFNKAPYVSYTDPLTTAEKIYNQIKDSCDAVVAITHQSINDDVLLAKKLPNLAMIIGGHEHDKRFQKVGNVLITKAHANAKSAYILNLRINKTNRTAKVISSLESINADIPFDPSTDSVVKKWTSIAEKSYAQLGFDSKKLVRMAGEPLDGREGEIRNRPTNLSRIIISGIEAAAPQADLAIVNSGSIRVDDILQMPITEYDILRTLPFGGSIVEVDMKGSLLLQVLQAGHKNKGIGGFLHYSPALTFEAIETMPSWKLNGQEISKEKTYRVALTDFLLTGGEANMEFLKADHPGMVKIYETPKEITDPRSDIRLAVIKYLRSRP